MKSTSRALLAQQASAEIEGGNCKGMGTYWAHQEAQWMNAKTKADAQRACQELLSVCDGCPVRSLCARWAQIERFTGVAGGLIWQNGRAYARAPLFRRGAALAS